MLTQTAALFLDAYRELNAKKMFWITLIISGVVVAAFATVGINSNGVTFLWYETPRVFGFSLNTNLIPRPMFYKWLFTGLGVDYWLNWFGIILALVSTASIIPDFISGGSVDLYLSKPISRLRLFLTKYLSGLLFVALQVLFFAFACFIVIGIRAGSWDLRIFLAVPVTVLVFSYLFSVCTLLAMLTHSTVASLLLTILFWLMVFGISFTAKLTLMAQIAGRIETEAYQRQFEFSDADLARLRAQLSQAGKNAAPAVKASLTSAENHRHDLEEKKRNSDPNREIVGTTYSVFHAAQTLLPKTGQTSDLLYRWLALNTSDVEENHIEERDRRRAARPGWFSGFQDRTNVRMDDAEVLHEMDEIAASRSAKSIIGSSLLFEAVILSLACWIFARRDY